jgi:hypothetical protein
MKVYIASSWKNKHGVEMLTELLRVRGCEVSSWIENCDKEERPDFNFEQWVKTPDADRCFDFDVSGATNCDLFIYYGPAGKDACAELGAAYGAKVPAIVGLYAKGEDLGLMRKMVTYWFHKYSELVDLIDHKVNPQDADHIPACLAVDSTTLTPAQ